MHRKIIVTAEEEDEEPKAVRVRLFPELSPIVEDYLVKALRTYQSECAGGAEDVDVPVILCGFGPQTYAS